MIEDNLKNKRLFLLDMDGTIYLDNHLFEDTLGFLDHVKSIGGEYIFFTNNSSKNTDDYVTKLEALSIKAKPSNIMTSSFAVSVYLQKHFPEKKIYVLGTKSLKEELKRKGINVVDRYEEDIDCLLVGFDTELRYEKLEDACRLLLKNVAFLGANPDLVCPTSFGFIPDCGSICKMLKTATGKKPLYIGKPKPLMVELALKSTEFSPQQAIIVGDRLYTDIACGINAGISTALVLSGETKPDDLKDTDFKPDYIFRDIGELLEAIK